MAKEKLKDYLVAAALIDNKKCIVKLGPEGLTIKTASAGENLSIPFEKIRDIRTSGLLLKKIVIVTNGNSAPIEMRMNNWKTFGSAIKLALSTFRGSRGIQISNHRNRAGVQKPPDPTPITPQTAGSSVPQAATAKTKISPKAPYKGTWPNGQDYEQSFQSLKVSMHPSVGNPDKWEVLRNPRNKTWYVQASGNYGAVYKIKAEDGRLYAIKCFTRNSQNLGERYLRLDSYLSNFGGRDWPLIGFRYFQDGIRVRRDPGYYFPIVKMDWIEGYTLNKFIANNLDDGPRIERIARKIVESVDWIQRAGIAHGDLSGDNIIVSESGKVFFVDYDGMFIPEFKGLDAYEIGHAGFQHPLRGKKHFGTSLDNFSALVIYFSLTAIAKNPELWDKFNDDDPDCLILRKKDFLNLKGSIAFNEATRGRSRRLKQLGNLLIQAVQQDPMWDGSSPGNLLSI
ncbi:hypothetical protein ApAK_05990 [Thermoplasmatales archaeon AK]|nr:hypothetical protein [Thermoplasmatales archaeon AK]